MKPTGNKIVCKNCNTKYYSNCREISQCPQCKELQRNFTLISTINDQLELDLFKMLNNSYDQEEYEACEDISNISHELKLQNRAYKNIINDMQKEEDYRGRRKNTTPNERWPNVVNNTSYENESDFLDDDNDDDKFHAK